jgi:tight adherence protein C
VTDALIWSLPGLAMGLAVMLGMAGLWLLQSGRHDVAQWHRMAAKPIGVSGPRPARSGLFERLTVGGVPVLRRIVPPRVLVWLQRQIDLAGRPSGIDVDTVLRQAVAWLLIMVPLAALLLAIKYPLGAALAVLLALLMPVVRLATAARKRQEQIDKDLPDYLDVLAVTVSAGLGFRSALGTVSERFGGPVAEEVTTALHQIANGATVRSAFKALRSRSQSASMEEFVTAYLQAEELGAPLVETLNHIAADMRRASAQRLRQQAARVAPRITLVMTLVMVPATLVLVIGGFVVGLAPDLGVIFRATR